MRAAVGRIQARSARPAGARRTVVVSMKPAKLGTDERITPSSHGSGVPSRVDVTFPNER